MNQNKLSFESENLILDYITFKFQESHCDQNKIAKYLFNLGFNSYQQSAKLSKIGPIQWKPMTLSGNPMFSESKTYFPMLPGPKKNTEKGSTIANIIPLGGE